MEIRIDQQRCTHCQHCIELCPTSVLGISERKVVARFPERCIACGHCFAFCPTGSISLAGHEAKDAPRYAAENLASKEALRTLLQGRRSIRRYRREAVPREVIEEALSLAGYAPSGGNRRPLSWTVVYTHERVQLIAAAVINWMRGELEAENPLASVLNFSGLLASWDKGNDPVLRKAPHLAIAHYPGPSRTTMHAGVIACTTLELAFSALGVGACWAGFLMIAATAPTGKAVVQACGLAEGSSILAGLMFGYPAKKPLRIPPRAPYPVVWLE